MLYSILLADTKTDASFWIVALIISIVVSVVLWLINR